MPEEIIYADTWRLPAYNPYRRSTPFGVALGVIRPDNFRNAKITGLYTTKLGGLQNRYVTGLRGRHVRNVNEIVEWSVRWDWDCVKGDHVNARFTVIHRQTGRVIRDDVRAYTAASRFQLARPGLWQRGPSESTLITWDRMTSDAGWNRNFWEGLRQGKEQYRIDCATRLHRMLCARLGW